MPIMCSIYFLCTLLYSCTIYYSYYCILFWLFLICMKIILTNIPIISKTRNIARAYGSKSSTVHNYCCTIEIDYTILYTNFSVYVCKHIYIHILSKRYRRRQQQHVAFPKFFMRAFPFQRKRQNVWIHLSWLKRKNSLFYKQYQ